MSDRITTPFSATSTAMEVVAGVDLGGKRALVTGGASGIGAETARALANAGANVTLAVRDLEAGEAVAEAINRMTTTPRVDVGLLDLADLASVGTFLTLRTGRGSAGSQANSLMSCVFQGCCLAPEGGAPAYFGRCRLRGEYDLKQNPISVWHPFQLRSYFYLSERLSLEPANMIVLARCKCPLSHSRTGKRKRKGRHEAPNRQG